MYERDVVGHSRVGEVSEATIFDSIKTSVGSTLSCVRAKTLREVTLE